MIYRASFDLTTAGTFQSNVTTIDDLDHCLQWAERWTGRLLPALTQLGELRFKALAEVTSCFPEGIRP